MKYKALDNWLTSAEDAVDEASVGADAKNFANSTAGSSDSESTWDNRILRTGTEKSVSPIDQEKVSLCIEGSAITFFYYGKKYSGEIRPDIADPETQLIGIKEAETESFMSVFWQEQPAIFEDGSGVLATLVRFDDETCELIFRSSNLCYTIYFGV